MTRRFLLLVAGLCFFDPAPIMAQEIRTAVTPDTAHVGDVVRAAIRVDLPPGHAATFPDSLPIAGDVENAGRMSRVSRPLPDGGSEVTAIYPLTPWRPGELELPDIAVVVEGPDGTRALQATFKAMTVRSVLPPDTAGIEPQPPKDVLGPSRVVWPYIAALVAALAALAAFLYWYRKRRRPLRLEEGRAVPPRERALEALETIRAIGLVEAGELKEFYGRTTTAVRAFLEEINPEWSGDLTTHELIDRMRATLDTEPDPALVRLLQAADLVKFANRRPNPAEAFGEWEGFRTWVATFEWRAPEPEPVNEPEAVPAVATGQEAV